MEKFLQAKNFTLDLVKKGYKLLTNNMPYSCFSNRNKSTLKLIPLIQLCINFAAKLKILFFLSSGI